MPFDPSQPFTLVEDKAPAFDPSQPFSLVDDEPSALSRFDSWMRQPVSGTTQYTAANPAPEVARTPEEGLALSDEDRAATNDVVTRVAKGLAAAPGVVVRSAGKFSELQANALDSVNPLVKVLSPEQQEAMRQKNRNPEVMDAGERLARLADYYQPDKARDSDLSSIMADFVGKSMPVVAAGPVAPFAGALMLGDQMRQTALQNGDSPEVADAKYTIGTTLGMAAVALPTGTFLGKVVPPTAVLNTPIRAAATTIGTHAIVAGATGASLDATIQALTQDKVDWKQVAQTGALTSVLGAVGGGLQAADADHLTQTDRDVLIRLARKLGFTGSTIDELRTWHSEQEQAMDILRRQKPSSSSDESVNQSAGPVRPQSVLSPPAEEAPAGTESAPAPAPAPETVQPQTGTVLTQPPPPDANSQPSAVAPIRSQTPGTVAQVAAGAPGQVQPIAQARPEIATANPAEENQLLNPTPDETNQNGNAGTGGNPSPGKSGIASNGAGRADDGQAPQGNVVPGQQDAGGILSGAGSGDPQLQVRQGPALLAPAAPAAPIAPAPTAESAPVLPEAPKNATVTPTASGPVIAPTDAQDTRVSQLVDRKQFKVQRDYLLDAATKAVAAAPETATGYVTFEVPGDGTFKVLNSRGRLQAFADVVGTRFGKAWKLTAENHISTVHSPFSAPVTSGRTAPGPAPIPAVTANPTDADLTKAVSIAVSPDPTRVALSHVLSENGLTVATDGRRLYVATGGTGKTAAEFEKLGTKFPNWRRAVPSWLKPTPKALTVGKDAPASFDVFTKPAIKTVNQAVGVTTEKSRGVRLHDLGNGKIGISATSPGVGDYYSEGVTQKTPPIALIDPQYLGDALRAARIAGHEKVKLYYTDPDAPVVVVGGKSFAAVTMPMKLDQPARATATPPPAATATEPVAAQKAAPPAGFKLPRELAGAKPRYAFGAKQFTLRFESELDKALYILAQKTPSRMDAAYLDAVTSQLGIGEAAARSAGRTVRDEIKALAARADGGTELTVPRVHGATLAQRTHSFGSTRSVRASVPTPPSGTVLTRQKDMAAPIPTSPAVTSPATGAGFVGITPTNNVLLQQFRQLQAFIAPTTMGPAGAAAGQTLRALLAEKASELIRAQTSVEQARGAFDRSPVDPRWEYNPAEPLPRNYAFVDAYETGNVAHLPPNMRALAAELHRMNTHDLARVHALGTGALRTYYENYFPRIWTDPIRAKNVIARILAKRPLEGGKGFLKQRSYDLFREALEAGLKPAHDNPMDIWLLKKNEVEHYILGVKAVQEWKAIGLSKFLYYADKMPEGWRAPADQTFEQWAPPFVTIKEAFDATMREKTLQALASLGVPHERLVAIGGKRWGYEQDTGVPGSERIVSKFGGPEFVVWHEMGHVLDNRYPDMRIAMFGGDPKEVATARARRNFKRPLSPTQTMILRKDDQLRALADERGGPKAYVRQTEEKMAVVLQAYLHAPELMARVAPDIQVALQKFLASHPELSVISDIKPGLKLGVGEAQMPVGGMVRLGSWIMPNDAAQVVDNYLSPGLGRYLGFQAMRNISHTLTAAQLSLSAFHVGFTTIDVIASHLDIAMVEASRGNGGAALAELAHTPISWLTNPFLGNRLKRAVLRDPDAIGPMTREQVAMQAVVRQLEAGGGRISQDKFFQTAFTRRTIRAISLAREQLKNGDYFRGEMNVVAAQLQLPFALVEQLARPVLEWLVPRQKLGVFARMAAAEMKRLGPNPPPDVLRQRMQLIWQSVENRMGEIAYDNYFYNHALKDVAMLSFRAFGWQQGKGLESGGAAVDTAKAAQNTRDYFKGKGSAPELTHKMAYCLALPIVLGVIGGLIHYLCTGTRPKGRDWFQPQTGEKDRLGNPVRLNLPTYGKDMMAYSHHPATTFAHSLNPAISAMFDLLGNRDFYDVQIRNPDDPLWKQGSDTAKWAATETTPFSFQGAMKLYDENAPAWKMIAPFFGFTPVPLRDTMTPAQELGAEIMQGSMPKEAMTQAQAGRGRLMHDIVRKFQGGDNAGAANDLATGIQSQKLTPTAASIFFSKLTMTPLQFQVNHFTPEQAMRVFRIANPEEQQALQLMIAKKVVNSQTVPMEDKAKMLSELRLGPAPTSPTPNQPPQPVPAAPPQGVPAQ